MGWFTDKKRLRQLEHENTQLRQENTQLRQQDVVVQDRQVTQGTRGENGQRYCERMWTVVGTYALQGRPVFQYLVDAVTAFFEGKPAPSLLPTDSS